MRRGNVEYIDPLATTDWAGDVDPDGDWAGAAYAFARSESGWEQTAKFAREDHDQYDWFGGKVAMADDGGTVCICAPYDEDPNGRNAGSVQVYGARGATR